MVTFLLRYFRHINILEIIFYSIVLYNYFHIYSETFLYARDFFSQRFPRKILMFFFVFVFYYCAIDFNNLIFVTNRFKNS